MSALSAVRRRLWQGMVLSVGAVLLSSCAWHGIANVPLPGGPGSGAGSYTVYAQMPDTLALNGNSKVMVADVVVGTVHKIELKNWVATLTLRLNKDVRLPKNATAKIGQTSILGSQHVELAPPADPSPQRLKNGDTIPLAHSSAYPNVERTLASVALILRGGGVPNLEVLSNEVTNIFSGRKDQIHDFLGKLDTFTAQLNEQRDDITRAIDSTNRLLAYAAGRSETLDRVLTEFPPLIKHFADKQDLFINAVDAVGRFSGVADETLSASRANLHQNLQMLQRPLKQISRGAPYINGALDLMATTPFELNGIKYAIRGDYINVSLMLDTTLSMVDNGILTGTGFSGALRALEQSWGRDPNTMIPDIRFTPNPLDAPGGPLVERGE
ncbi:mammalian cell entry protein [Mycobacterium talmoniae]|uniref:Mammalian cell entry protein n=2 Tax=Mycobacterium talmoniae TaxID=1858794 RepID=A0A1S1NKG5_9MYCO|nr:mammalian cell entry protein [Mycobacterium talmoniae]